MFQRVYLPILVNVSDVRLHTRHAVEAVIILQSSVSRQEASYLWSYGRIRHGNSRCVCVWRM